MERRISPRIPRDGPCLLTLVLEGEPCTAMLVDISVGGVHLVLSPGDEHVELIVHAKGVLTEVPGGLGAVLENSTGHVAWVAARHCGLRLDTQIDLPAEKLIELTPL